MSFDRSTAKRHQVDFAHRDHVAAFPFPRISNEDHFQLSQTSCSTSANVDIILPKVSSLTTAIESSVAIRLNGHPYNGTSDMHLTSQATVQNHYPNDFGRTLNGIDTFTISNTIVDTTSRESRANEEIEVCYGMVRLSKIVQANC